MKQFLFPFFISLLLVGCESNQTIVSNIDEREANEIVVFLASKGVDSAKVQASSGGVGVETVTNLFNIMVDEENAVDAMSYLNQVGLPRREGTTLLELFAKSGLMQSDREETIRYQAGLAEELRNTIRKFDGVLDANVQISFPQNETVTPGVAPPKISAAVYVKHQGVLEDPNSHLEVKIKRLLAGSINGLDYDSVAVISDRAKIADIVLNPQGEWVGPKTLQQTYVSIWGIVMTKGSLLRFRTIFFFFIFLFVALLGVSGWMIYRFYPEIRRLSLEKKEPPPPEL